MQISEEMVEVARTAYHDARAEASGAGRRHDDSLMRAALEAVMSMIRAEVLEEAAKMALYCSGRLGDSAFKLSDAITHHYAGTEIAAAIRDLKKRK